MTTLSVLPFLMFQGQAAQALDFYVSLFPDARIDQVEHHVPSEPGLEGRLRRARLMLGGQTVLCTDSIVPHGFGFTPAFSFFIDCGSEEQLRDLATRLAEDGKILMPVGDHGFGSLFGWVQDRFGVSWQLNLP